MDDPGDDHVRTHPSELRAVRDPTNHRAWEAFVDRYRPMVRGWCRQWFQCDDGDAVQEVFLRLVSIMQRYEYDPEKGRFRSYLKTVTHNLMADLKRRPPDAPIDPEKLDGLEAPLDLWARLAAEYDLELLEIAKEAVRRRVESRTWRAWSETAERGRKPAEVAVELGMRVGAVYQARHAVQDLLRAEVQSRDGVDEPTRGAR
jgi:RNA polymerase sigma-70 factor (ECF subfamily)